MSFNLYKNIVEIVMKIWPQTIGKVLVGVLIASIPYYYIVNRLELELSQKDLQIKKLEKNDSIASEEIKAWQLRAYEADKNCFDKIKEISTFMDSMREGYNSLEIKSRKIAEIENEIIKKLE